MKKRQSNQGIEMPLLNNNPRQTSSIPIPPPSGFVNKSAKIDDKLPFAGSHTKSHFADFLKYTPDTKFIQKLPFFDWIFFLDAFKLVMAYNRTGRTLTLDDMPLPFYKDNPEVYLQKLDGYWQDELQDQTHISLFRAIFKTFKWKLLLSLILGIIDYSLRFTYIWLMGNIINYITQTNIPTGIIDDDYNRHYKILLQTIGMIICMFASLIVGHWVFYRNFVLGILLRLSLTCLLYKKIHSISLNSLNQLNIGKVVNLAANDFNELDLCLVYLIPMLLAPFTILIAAIMLWNHFGMITLFGLISLILILPCQCMISAMSRLYKSEKSTITDERIKLINEMIECIRLIKMYAWEKPIQYTIEKLRIKEINLLKKIYLYEGIGRAISNSSVYFSSFLIFITYVIISDGELTAQKVYSTVTILFFIKYNGILYFLFGRNEYLNMNLVFNRVQDILLIPDVLKIEETKNTINNQFLNMEHIQMANNQIKMSNQDQDLSMNIRVVMEKFTGYWSNLAIKPCLKNININIEPNTLVAVIGEIGSGKTSFLLSFLRELSVTQGILECNGKIAYVEQEPYVFEGTLKDNVLFGNKLDKSFYDDVLDMTSLKDDLFALPKRDDTLIGEKGVTLSGGQRARVSLARAIYSQSDIYLLDDPLSAVDAKVAKNIFNKAIKGYLRHNKIVFLVTHHVHFAKEADHIILFNDGQIESQGSYSEMIQKKIDFMRIFPQENESYYIKERKRISETWTNIETFEKPKLSIKEVEAQMFELEDKDSTFVTKQTYLEYIRNAGGFRLFAILISLFITHEIFNLAYNRYIGYWAYIHENYYIGAENETKIIEINKENDFYIKFIGILLIFSILLNLIKIHSLNLMIITSAARFHHQLVNHIIHAKIRFFDTNPIGRILNRFSGDIGMLDKNFCATSFDLIEGILYHASLILALSYTNTYILPFGIFIIYMLNKCRNSFENYLSEARKIDLVARSPIYSQISSTINGLLIIRAYNQGGRFITILLKNIYNNNKACLAYVRTVRSFGFSLDFLIYVFTTISLLFFVIYTFFNKVESGLFGMALVCLLNICGNAQWTIRQILYLNMNMASTQRIIEYNNVPIENYDENYNTFDEQINKHRWLKEGNIYFNNVYLRYDNSTDIFALKGLTFSIKAKEKVGCVGRTGAGKSSIIQVLFRMFEIEPKSDSFIKIDSKNIRDIDLHELRSSLAIIPQSAVVFNKSIRRNLDPLNLYTDDLIWKALEDVNLKHMIMKLENRLDTDMTISNSIFSVGQKQLICLARVILRQSKILILDEATANVDLATDDFIQHKIKELFKDCTVITIAHRLTTIADYDKVLVMDQGRAVEYGHPYKLLVKDVGDDSITNMGGEFAKMVLNTGVIVSNRILNIAKQSYFESVRRKTKIQHGTN